MVSRINIWKSKIESNYGRFALLTAKHPLLFLSIFGSIIVGLSSQLIHIRADASVEGFLEEGSTEITQYTAFKNTFGRDEVFMVIIETEDLFKQSFIDKLRDMHEQIENEVPYLSAVESLVNARYTYGEDDGLYIEALLPEVLPSDEAELATLKDYTYNNPSYVNYLISEDRHMLGIAVRLNPFLYTEDENGVMQQGYLEEKHQKEAMDVLYRIIEEHKGKLSDDIKLAGASPVNLLLGSILEKDFGVFAALAVLIISVLLAFVFKRASGVILPIIVMVLAIIITISMMAIMDTPIQVSTSILPSFLLAVCVGDSIHLLSIFYQHYDSGERKHIALQKTMEHTGMPIFFTSVTTAAGLASFATSDLSPVSALGVYGAFGSMVAYGLTVSILPCLITLAPIKRKQSHKQTIDLLTPILKGFAAFSTGYPKIIVSFSLTLFVLGLLAASQVQFSHMPLAWLPQDHKAVVALKHQEQRMGGTLNIEIVIDTGAERGINNADFMIALDETLEEIKTWSTDDYKIAKVISVTDIIKESNRGLHDNDQAQYSIPNNSDLIGQELFLVELDVPDDLFRLIDRQYQRARVTILMPWVDSLHLIPMIDRIEKRLNENLADKTDSIVITGVTSILGATFTKMLYSTAKSYGLAAGIITLMMILLIGSVKLGALSMIPALLPITLVIAALSLLNIPLDMLTMLVGSIAIGLTVDGNVHFMHNFRKIYDETGDPELAVKQTMETTGRALLITSIALCSGFAVYTQSMMNNMQTFGATTASCIFLAMLATFLLAPALMMITNKNYRERLVLEGQRTSNKLKPAHAHR